MGHAKIVPSYCDAYRSSDWAIMRGSTLDIEVDAIWCFALELQRSSCGVVEVLVQQLELMLAGRRRSEGGYPLTSLTGLEMSEKGTGTAIVDERVWM